MLTPSCDLLPSTSFSSLIIDSAYQQAHLLPLGPGMSDAEALTLADFGFPDEEAVQQAEDAWFVGRQAKETQHVDRKAKSRSVSVSEVVGKTPTSTTSGGGCATGYGYTAFRAANPGPDGKKKKGRPVGWRKSVHMKPKTEILHKAPPTTAAPFELPETKKENKDAVKIESPPSPATAAPLSSDSEIQKANPRHPLPSPAPASTGYAAFRAANPGAEKFGRPVGWKMGVHAKRKRIEKEKFRKKSSKKLANSKDGSKILAAIEMKGEQEASPFEKQDGEISTQLDQKPTLVESSLQLNWPTYNNIAEKQQSMDLDEDGFLPASFWEGVLAAANTAIPTIDSTPSEIILEPKSIPGQSDGEARRDSAHDTIAPPFPSFAATNQAVLPDSTDEIVQDDEGGSSGMSHFSA